jgi:hypothetical protein
VTAVMAARLARLWAGSWDGERPAIHPVDVLRWLRNGILLCVAATAATYLWIAVQAGSDIAAAQRTQQAMTDLGAASGAVKAADSALDYVFFHEDPTLVGTGSEFDNYITEVNKELALAAGSNAASTAVTSDIQYVENQLTSYLQLSETAVTDYEQGPVFGRDGQGYASGAETAVQSAITKLTVDEKRELRAQRAAWVLHPASFWWALLGPVIGFVLLVAATARVLARHFRRHVSPYLWGALVIVAAITLTVGFLNAGDAQSLAPGPEAGQPVTAAIVLLLLLATAALAQLAYHPRLAQYRFRSS